MKCFSMSEELRLKELLQEAWRFGYNTKEINSDLEELKTWVQQNDPRKESSQKSDDVGEYVIMKNLDWKNDEVKNDN